MTDKTLMTTQVAIVGGGPVGLGLAIELGQRGIHCLLVERFETPQPIPKGQNLTQRSMEHFHFWGAESQLRAARTVPKEYGIGGMTAYGSLLGDYQHDWLQRQLVRPFYFTDNERLPQYATEAVLRQRVSELPSVQTRYGWKLDHVGQDDSGTTLEISQREGPGRQTLRAEYSIGCDGAKSVLRSNAGITQTLAAHDRLMVLLVFRSPGLHELLKRFPGKSFYNIIHPEHQGYWQFFGRVDLGTTWFFHAPVPMGTTADNFDFRAYLHRSAGAEFEVEFEHIGFWDLRFAVADSYRAGRLFIAGDAAHSHPPYGGYGINTGFEDAANLGWKLAARLQGWGGEALLDSYTDERQPVFASTAADFIAKSIEVDRQFLASFDPARDRPAFEAAWALRSGDAKSEVNAFEPNYEGSAIVYGPPEGICTALGAHQFTARPGHHLAPMNLSTGRNLYEELGDGMTLLLLDAEPASSGDFSRAAVALGIPLKVISDSRDGGRERYGVSQILIRPDQFVAWVGSDQVEDPVQILVRATGASPEAQAAGK